MRYYDRYNIKKIKYFTGLYKKKFQNNKIQIKEKKVGSGFVGEVFEISFIKDNTTIFKFIVKRQPFDIRYRYERYFNIETAKLVNNKVIPNFIKHYDSYVLNNQVSFLMENADRGLDHWSLKERTFEQYLSFAFQILSALYVFKKYIRGCHYDVSYQNIMYIKLKDTEDKYFEYKINEVSYYIPIFGKLFLLIDFGRGRSLKLSKDNETKKCIEEDTDLYRFKNIFEEMKYLYHIEKLQLKFDYNDLLTKLKLTNSNIIHDKFIIIKSRESKVQNERFDHILRIIEFMKVAEENNILQLNTFHGVNDKYLNFINNITSIDNFYIHFDKFTVKQPKNKVIDTFKMT
ncbi:MAG: hypothetical protein CMF62_04060 [Magnetococcales bacterium]|nr:hypothetical protein [Magnetococcales bacterium]|tara:strand:- start:5670 stop:6704 length:1035 start_codon:yes stop_codon:yes gene_type:complete